MPHVPAVLFCTAASQKGHEGYFGSLIAAGGFNQVCRTLLSVFLIDGVSAGLPGAWRFTIEIKSWRAYVEHLTGDYAESEHG